MLCPTGFGWLFLLIAILAPVALWWWRGEAFFSMTERLPAQVLVLEAWTGPEGAQGAAAEFHRPDSRYPYIVDAGGYTGESWTTRRWDSSEIARQQLVRFGIPSDKILVAW